MNVVTDWETLSREVTRDRRKGKRVNLRFPIEVSGFNPQGVLFAENTETTDISEAGCRFALKESVARGDVVAVKLRNRRGENRDAAQAELFQVIWRARDGEFWLVGALKLRNDKFWEVSFPPKNPPEPPNL
ncbi:MAG TPA: PilZ domain-containing protein [Methylomirabilota bacterium]|jgi:hypothetical protein|nr:PilZ domain-containing protein [Methylomirabilota bacterium]